LDAKNRLINTDTLAAQGEQRRSSIFNFRQDILKFSARAQPQLLAQAVEDEFDAEPSVLSKRTWQGILCRKVANVQSPSDR
jgi:hypothetical protein